MALNEINMYNSNKDQIIASLWKMVLVIFDKIQEGKQIL